VTCREAATSQRRTTRFGSVKSLGTATSAVFDLAAAQKLFGRGDKLDGVLVAGRDGMPAAQLRSDLAQALPETQVTSAEKQDRFTLEGLEDFISIIKIALLIFGGVAILVGAFTIFNTLSITVAQRTRELGRLRMVGAYRRQVLGSVLVEALAVGLLASVIGLLAGLGLAKALDALFDSMGLSLPEAGTVFALRTIVVSLLVGTLVTLIAGLVPAWHATRVAPVEALHSATPGAGRVRLPGRIVRAMASLIGRPAQAIGGAAGGLARRNAMRQPGRTMGTAAALMIGVALVTLVTVVGAGLKDTTRRARAADRREPCDHGRGRLVADRAGGRAGARPRRRRHGHPPGHRARVRRQGDDQRDRSGDKPGHALVRLGTGRRQRPGAARHGWRDRRRGLGQGAPARRRRPVHAQVGRFVRFGGERSSRQLDRDAGAAEVDEGDQRVW
jgi:hypothetical protein